MLSPSQSPVLRILTLSGTETLFVHTVSAAKHNTMISFRTAAPAEFKIIDVIFVTGRKFRFLHASSTTWKHRGTPQPEEVPLPCPCASSTTWQPTPRTINQAMLLLSRKCLVPCIILASSMSTSRAASFSTCQSCSTMDSHYYEAHLMLRVAQFTFRTFQ